MKKFTLLLLVLTGMVSTASAYYSLPGGWNWAVDANKFDETTNTITILLNSNQTYEFKFYNSDYHSDSYDGYHGNNGTITSSISNWEFKTTEGNCKLNTTIAGEYTFTLSWNGTMPLISVTYPTTYTRSIGANNYGTVCLPFNATVTDGSVYQITKQVKTNGNLTGVVIEPVTSLTAGKGYIIKESITATLSGDYTESTTDNGMVGNLTNSSISVTSGNYVIYGNQVCPVGTDVTIGQYKAYITLTGIPVITITEARGLDFIGSDEGTTGINMVQGEGLTTNGYYNLAGQRVQPTKGVYIVNGKKVAIK